MIDWTAYRAFLADVEKAESSGRRWHCECLCDDGSWGQAAVYECGPDACHYRVVYDDPLEPEVPLEGWCGVYTLNGSRVLSSAVFDTEEQAKRWCGKCETVRVREVVEATPNPLAEAVLQAKKTARCPVCNGDGNLDGIRCEVCKTLGWVYVGDATPNPLAEAAAEVLADPNPLSEEVERLAVAIGKERSEVEILRADRDRLKRMVDDPCNVWNSCCRLTDQLSEMTDNRDKLSEEVSRLQMELEAANAANVGAEQEVERLNSELAKRHSTICNLTEEVERLRDIHDNGPFECLYCGNRIEGDDHWRTCEKHPVNAEIERLKLEAERADDTITRLRVADAEMDAEIKRLRRQLDTGAAQYATACAERDRLTRRLAVYEGMCRAMADGDLSGWAEKNGLCRQCDYVSEYPEYYVMCARRCRELAGEVG